MKRKLLHFGAVFLMAICAMPALAQLSNGSRYYRVRNAESGKYLAITNDKFSCDSCIRISGSASNAASNPTKSIACANAFLRSDIKLVDDPGSIIPGSIIYAKQRNTSTSGKKQYNLIAQGTSLLTLTTGQYFGDKVQPTFSNIYALIEPLGDNMYNASIELKASLYGLMNYSLGVRYLQDDNGTLAIVESNSLLSTKWYFEPISQFNVEPDVAYNGKYYTTMYVHFPFVLGSSMKAYYITGVTNDGTLSYYTYSSGSTIPAATPVILECSSPNAAENILQLTSTEPEFTDPVSSARTAPMAQEPINPSGNLLKGTYYCNTDGNVTVNKYILHLNKYTATTNPQKYVLGTSLGKFGFVEATNNNTNNGKMPANKAWMEQAGKFAIIRAVAMPVISPNEGTYGGPQNVTITCSDTPNGAIIHYTTDGTDPTWESPTYSGAIPVDETTTIKAIAIIPGLQNNSAGFYTPSDVASATYTIQTPEITITPTSLTINDSGTSNTLTVNGSCLNDNVGILFTDNPNNDFSYNLQNGNGTYFPINNGSVINGLVNITFNGRALAAHATIRAAAGQTNADATVTYKPDIYIYSDNGSGNWGWNNALQMDDSDNDGIYTATLESVPANGCILFGRLPGQTYDWNVNYNGGNRLFFGAQTDGGDWVYINDPVGNLELNPTHNYKYCPIKFQDAGTYIVTVNTNNNTFTITAVIESTLAQIEANGTVGNTYAMSDELIGTWAYGTILWAKDYNSYNGYTVNDTRPAKTDGQIDYARTNEMHHEANNQTYNWVLQNGNWDQSNWVALDFIGLTDKHASDYVGKKISGIRGTYTDAVNYTIALTEVGDPIEDQSLTGKYQPNNTNNPMLYAYTLDFNTYLPANFYTSNHNKEVEVDGVSVVQGFKTHNIQTDEDVELYFMNPKIQEVARIWGVWNETTQAFTVYETSWYNHYEPRISGAVSANWQYNVNGNVSNDLVTGNAYCFHAVVNKKTVSPRFTANTPTASDNEPSSDYNIYPLDFVSAQSNYTALGELNFDVIKQVESVRYYNVMGMESKQPFEGINIVVTRYTDGTTSTMKVIR
jgi:hypothetical protein